MLLKHIEFVRLNSTTILAVVVAKTGIVHNVMFDIDPSIKESELTQVSNYLNHHFENKSLMEVKMKIMNEMKTDKMKMDHLFRNVSTMAEGIFSRSSGDSDIIVSSTSGVLGLPEFSDVNRLKGLLDTFEEKKNLSLTFSINVRTKRV